MKVSKSKMYSLVSDKVGGLPKMKDVAFKSYSGTYWAEYGDVETGHLMKVCLDRYAGSIHLIVDDRSDRESYIIKMSQEEMISRGIIGKK